ncbi:hypothetical protein ACFLZX_00265 [Nanoarchaeota archaeon]
MATKSIKKPVTYKTRHGKDFRKISISPSEERTGHLNLFISLDGNVKFTGYERYGGEKDVLSFITSNGEFGIPPGIAVEIIGDYSIDGLLASPAYICGDDGDVRLAYARRQGLRVYAASQGLVSIDGYIRREGRFGVLGTAASDYVKRRNENTTQVDIPDLVYRESSVHIRTGPQQLTEYNCIDACIDHNLITIYRFKGDIHLFHKDVDLSYPTNRVSKVTHLIPNNVTTKQ